MENNSKRCLMPHRHMILLACALVMVLTGCATAYEGADLYGIYTSAMDGRNMKAVVYDSYREINHARVSPDGKWITFTRYNKKGLNGRATEENGYKESEIMLVRTDGTGLESIVPAKKGVIAANSYWTPDGKGLIYVSDDNPEGKGGDYHIDIATRKITRLPTPKDFVAADPHQVGDKVTFTKMPGKGEKIVTVWLMNADGSNARQMSSPKFPNPDKRAHPPLGDYDPKLSPDGKKLAFFRHFGDDNWHIVVVDVETGQEKDLSAPVVMDGNPEWSSDGKLLIFWYGIKEPRLAYTMGLYTMKADGSGRKMVSNALPEGYFYTHPAFFPNDGSGPDARIIFTARKEPILADPRFRDPNRKRDGAAK